MTTTSNNRVQLCLEVLQGIATEIIAVALCYAATWGFTHDQALPGGSLFALFLLLIWCSIGSKVAEFLGLPSLTGTLLMGFVYRNFLFVSFSQDIPEMWSKYLRNAAFTIILLRAGLSLDPKILRKLRFICLRLSLVPMLIEALAATLLSRILFNFPWSISCCFGFLLAGLSPAVVVPNMIALEKEGYNENNGILTLIIAAGTLDGIFAITGVSFAISAVISSDISQTIIKSSAEVIVGLLYGILIGVICWYIPSKEQEHRTFYKIFILTFGGLAANFIGLTTNSSAAGAFGCLSLAFVAALQWRKDCDENVHVLEFEDCLWKFLEIFLFGLIGAEVSVDNLKRKIGFSFIILLTGICCRILSTYCILFGSNFTSKEKLFICLSWIPKATVQAAMGSLVLDNAKLLQLGSDYIQHGEMVLTVCVLSIVVTAPIGAILIKKFGPILLSKPSALGEIQILGGNYGSCDDTERNIK